MSEPDRPARPDAEATVQYSREHAQQWREDGAGSSPWGGADNESQYPGPGDVSPGYGSAGHGSSGYDSSGYGSSGYGSSDYPSGGYSSENQAATSVYPAAGRPAYAPTGSSAGPADWAPEVPPVVPVAPVPPPPPSRILPGVLGALLGLVLVALGLYLLVRFGTETVRLRQEQLRTPLLQPVLAAVGAVLIGAAVALDGWSPWVTLLPGIALTGAGGWAFFSADGLDRVTRWTDFAFKDGQFSTWHTLGATLAIGLLMLGASLAATVARAGGRWAGRYSAGR